MTSEGISYFPHSLTDNAKTDSSSSPTTRSQETAHAPLAASNGSLTELSDSDLLIAMGNGSKDALSTLFQRHARRIYVVCQRILKDDAEAEDLVQDLFINLFHKASQYDSTKGSAISWIIQMTYHRAFDRKRYLDFRHHYNHIEFSEERMESSHGRVSITEIAARTLLERLRDELSTDQFRALELYLFHGYSFDEIAKKNGHTLGTVRNHYYRGLKLLHAYIFPVSHGNERMAIPKRTTDPNQ
jgi:RNA polymerase sigma-70 factor (ECF subfamily)